jgi:hypothetical protein
MRLSLNCSIVLVFLLNVKYFFYFFQAAYFKDYNCKILSAFHNTFLIVYPLLRKIMRIYCYPQV